MKKNKIEIDIEFIENIDIRNFIQVEITPCIHLINEYRGIFKDHY